MPHYRIAGQNIFITCPVPELEYLQTTGGKKKPLAFPFDASPNLVWRLDGFVGGRIRQVEVSSLPNGNLLKVDGGSDVFISQNGAQIVHNGETDELSALDREILSGPALVLALASCKTFCLHASAAQFGGQVFVFLGESGQGKSTLAAYLSTQGKRDWTRVADDILPVTAASSHAEACPRYPQLKLPPASQPGTRLPEWIPIRGFFLLQTSPAGDSPGTQRLPLGQAVQTLIAHTAGARLFDPRLLADHLAFSSRTAQLAPVYTLSFPRRKNALPTVKELLENLC